MTKTPTPYSHAWRLEQPPERLTSARARFEAVKDRLPENERRYLEAHLPPPDAAAQIDRDMDRIFGREQER